MTRKRIIVIGGGLAGLSAATHCADEGADVTLIESRKRLGGATWSNFHRGLGFEIDNGQHVFMRCCDHYLAFLDRLGVRDCVTLQQRLNVPIVRPGGQLSWIRRSPLPAPAHLASSLLRFPTLTTRERLHAAMTALRFKTLDPDAPALDDQSLGDWLSKQGESQRAIEGLWDLLIRPTLNLPARDASLALAARVMRTGFLESASGADIGWSNVPFEALHAQPGRRVLEKAGARILTNAPIDGIDCSGSDGAAVYSKGSRFSADAVILAVPHDVAARLLPDSDRFDGKALAELPYSPIVNLHAVFDRKVSDHEMVAGIDSDLQWIFDRTHSHSHSTSTSPSTSHSSPSDHSTLGDRQYLTVALSAADRWLGHSTGEMRAIFEPQFKSLFPRARNARMEQFAVTIERNATFRATPGTRRLRPPAGTEVAGVFLAGAWTDTGWPATMEGAVRSGLSAARAALDSEAGRASGEKEAA